MKRPEQDLQMAVARFLKLALPDLVWFAIPNGGYRTKAEAGIMKATGTRKGVPDLAFILPTGSVGFIELKAAKGRLSPDQIAFRDSLPPGAFWAEARSIIEVQDILERWLTPFGWNLNARVAA